jgi:hypothetical protein
MTQEEIEVSKVGVRNNLGKPPWHLFMWDAAEEVVNVLAHGRLKYAARNWEKGLSWSETFDSAVRHMKKWYYQHQDLDEDSGLHHLAHAAWNILALLSFSLWGGKHLENDDRPDYKKEVGL